MSITRVTYYQCKPKDSQKLAKLCQSWIPKVNAAPGCNGAECFQGIDQPNQCVMIVNWDSDAKQAAFHRKLKASGAMDAPELKILTAEPKSFNYILAEPVKA